MKNDPFSYLSGFHKSVSKGAEQKARMKKPKGAAGGSTGVEAPDGHSNPAMRGKASHHSSNEKFAGAATVASRKSSTKASSAKLEGNESAKYEKLEKKSLRSMKHGGSEKELRQGHNDGGKVEKVMKEYKSGELHSGSKKGPKVKSRKQAIAIGLSEARKAGEKIKRKK